jgi:hypothetical protein
VKDCIGEFSKFLSKYNMYSSDCEAEGKTLSALFNFFLLVKFGGFACA